VLKGDSDRESIDHLCRFPRFHLVEIDGFNSFFAELYAGLNPSPHPIFSDPYSVAKNNLGGLISRLRIPSNMDAFPTQLANDVSLLSKRIQEKPDFDVLQLPLDVLVWNELTQKRIAGAKGHVHSALAKGTPDVIVRNSLRILKSNWDGDFANTVIEALEDRADSENVNVAAVNDMIVDFLSLGHLEHAKRVAMSTKIDARLRALGERQYEFFCINKGQVGRRLDIPLDIQQRDRMNEIMHTSNSTLSKLGAAIILEEFNRFLELYTANSKDGLIDGFPINHFLQWPIVNLVPDDVKQKMQNDRNGREDRPIART
jgi:hypothetical protein